MIYEIEEKVLRYDPIDYKAWKQGDKRYRPANVSEEVISTIDNQPRNHFGESFVLNHYSQCGWKGFAFYALGAWVTDKRYKKWRPGQLMVEKLVPTMNLQKFRAARKKEDLGSGAGEPDLFLYNDLGEFMFVEVKLDNDQPDEQQLKCIAQIKKYINCPAYIARVVPVDKAYKDKMYNFVLDA